MILCHAYILIEHFYPVGTSIISITVTKTYVLTITINFSIIFICRIRSTTTEFFMICLWICVGSVIHITRERASWSRSALVISKEINKCIQPLQTIGNEFVLPENVSSIQWYRAVVIYSNLVRLRCFSSNKDNTKSSSSSIDSSGSSILKNCNRFNIFRVYSCQITLHAIDKNKSTATLTYRMFFTFSLSTDFRSWLVRCSTSTDGNSTLMSRLTIWLNNIQTRNLSLKGSCNIGIGSALKFLTWQVFNGTNQLSFLKSTISNDYSRLQGLSILLHNDIQRGSLFNIYLDSFVAKKLTYKNSIGICLNRKRAVCICRSTYRCTLYHDGYTWNRLVSYSIFYKTRYGEFLRKCLRRHKKQENRHNGRHQTFRKQ